jgi:hypothetical protein
MAPDSQEPSACARPVQSELNVNGYFAFLSERISHLTQSDKYLPDTVFPEALRIPDDEAKMRERARGVHITRPTYGTLKLEVQSGRCAFKL